MKLKIKSSIEWIFMKKLLLICVLLVGIIFISGCIGEKKINSKTSTDSHTSIDSQTSEPLIRASDLPKGYYCDSYTTYTIPQFESFEIRPNFNYNYIINSKNEYEGDIPKGKKRIATRFRVTNDDSNIQMNVLILESDSNSKLKEYISELESVAIRLKDASEQTNSRSILRGGDLREIEVETDLVGDNSILTLKSHKSVDESGDEYLYGVSACLTFTSKNYVVSISGSDANAREKETMRKETLKVAKAIESKLD